jgi:predicted transcriptional regulator YheO
LRIIGKIGKVSNIALKGIKNKNFHKQILWHYYFSMKTFGKIEKSKTFFPQNSKFL